MSESSGPVLAIAMGMSVLSVCIIVGGGVWWWWNYGRNKPLETTSPPGGSTPETLPAGSVPNRFVSQVVNGKAFFPCLAQHMGINTLGKTWDGYNKCDVPYGPSVYSYGSYTVVKPAKKFKWAAAASADKRIKYGFQYNPDGSNRRATYLCRAKGPDGNWYPGIGGTRTGKDSTCWIAVGETCATHVGEKCSTNEKTVQTTGNGFQYAVYE